MKGKRKLLVFLVVASVTVAINGCGIRVNKEGYNKATVDGKAAVIERETHVIELQGAKKAEVDIDMGVGELEIKESTDKMMTGEFTYNGNTGEPQVFYSVKGEEGDLKITHPSSKNTNEGKSNSTWDLAFNKDIPLSMHIDLSVGESNIDLSKVNINDLDIKAGVGEATINLAGNYKNDVDVNIKAGVGEVEIVLPKDIGVEVEIDKGLGEIKANGFRIENDNYVNDNYGKTKNNMNVYIDSGVGEVKLTLQ